MGIIIESHDELFSLLVDHVEDVMTINFEDIEHVPPTLNPLWQSVCEGVYQMQGKIMILIDIERILDLTSAKAA
jgi:purine-binding chemotaxis protein CheW